MPTYNIQGWIWAGTGSPTTLLPLVVSDDDPQLSPYFTNDPTETITIAGTTYTNPRGGTYQLTFDDPGGTTQTEDFLLWSTGGNFVFAPLPGSAFDSGSTITSLGGWQDYTSGFNWADVTCFTSGTLIRTASGARNIDTIKVDDQIETPLGFSQVVWVGRRHVTIEELARNPKLFPVRITAGALGDGLPQRDLLVSRQHRMLVRSQIVQRMFNTTEVLIPAIKLTALPGIYLDTTVPSVDYVHLLFERHEVIFAEDAPTESLFTGPEALKSVSEEAREEILSIFPELADLDYTPKAARLIPPGRRQKKLVERHLKNNRPLLKRGY